MLFDFLILLVFAFIFYGACLNGELVFDDHQTIMGNTDVRDGKWRNIPLGDFRGLANWTLAVSIHIWGLSTFSLHVGNVLIHTVNGLILLSLSQELGFDHAVSLVGALLFIGHPLAVGTTAYISGRASLLSATFGLLAIWAVVASMPLLAIPAVFLAIMAKEDAAILPVTLLAVALVTGKPTWVSIVLLIVLLLLVLNYARMIGRRLKRTGSDEMAVYGYARQLEHPTYFLTAATETILRLPLWFVGQKLSADPDIRVPDKARIACAVALVLILAAIFFILPPTIQIGVILAVISPLLVSWVIPLPDPVMEYRAYLALAGGGVLWISLIDRLPWMAVTFLVAWQWVIGAHRVFNWQTQLGFWLTAARDGSGDKPRVISNIGAAYQARGDFKSAEPYLLDTIKRHPELGMPFANLAYIRAQQGKLEEAKTLLEHCVDICPKYERAWAMLHAAYHHLKNESGRLRCEEALAAFKKG